MSNHLENQDIPIPTPIVDGISVSCQDTVAGCSVVHWTNGTITAVFDTETETKVQC